MENGSLFVTKKAKHRALYKLYASSIFAGIFMIWWYRASNIPEVGGQGRWAWIGMFAAELWFCFYWIITQFVRWCPVYHSTFKDRLLKRHGKELPGVDVFVCTADPEAEPPSLVISTVLSVMAYDYPPDKLSVYLSDDAGSELTFYALLEAAQFAKHWLPFCRKNKVEPRSPEAYFSGRSSPHNGCNAKEWSSMKNLYQELANRIASATTQGKIPEDENSHKGFAEWNSGMSKRNHPAIVQILVNSADKDSADNDGKPMPTLVYMAREKSPHYKHNFKAGAMNAVIRVSSQISNSPIILNVDCDMHSNDSESIKDALCFFLDEQKGHDIAFVQYPQHFGNITRNDLYANAFNVVNEVEHRGLDSCGGMLYIGTGCFHRREILCGRKYSENYKEDWSKGVKREEHASVLALEERAKTLVTCTYEDNTLWGKEVGLKYGCPVEDIITGLLIQTRGWKSISFDSSRRGFMGIAPLTLEQTLVQHKRWSEGNFQIFMSKYSSLIFGHGKIKLALQLGYCIYGLWAPNSLPTLYYVTIPPLCLLSGISLFPKVSSPWFIPFAYVATAKNIYSLVEAVKCDDTIIGWWNTQRMWLLKRTTSYLFATIDTFLKLLGISEMTFVITAKVSDPEAHKRFEREVMEFGSSCPMFVIIGILALLNALCLAFGLYRLLNDGVDVLDRWFIHIFLCGIVVALNLPIYEAMFLRKDTGALPRTATFASICFSTIACLLAVMMVLN